MLQQPSNSKSILSILQFNPDLIIPTIFLCPPLIFPFLITFLVSSLNPILFLISHFFNKSSCPPSISLSDWFFKINACPENGVDRLHYESPRCGFLSTITGFQISTEQKFIEMQRISWLLIKRNSIFAKFSMLHRKMEMLQK